MPGGRCDGAPRGAGGCVQRSSADKGRAEAEGAGGSTTKRKTGGSWGLIKHPRVPGCVRVSTCGERFDGVVGIRAVFRVFKSGVPQAFISELREGLVQPNRGLPADVVQEWLGVVITVPCTARSHEQGGGGEGGGRVTKPEKCKECNLPRATTCYLCRCRRRS